ncbi:hypothetical protein D3C86_1519710 [compost metagenome]
MQSGGTVDQHRPADPHADFAIGTGQAPFLLHRLPVIPGRIGKGQAVVVSQVFRCLWRAPAGEIFRRGAHGQGVVDQRAGDQVGGLQRPEAKRYIEAVFQQIRASVGQYHVEFHPRVLPAELTQCRRQAFGTEGQRRGDAQDAARFVQRLLGQALGVGHQPQHFQAALVIRGAELGQPLAPRRAVEQAHTQPLLQGLEVIADHGRGHFALQSGGGHAAGLHHFHVNAHCLEQIHYQAQLLND